MNNNSKNPNHNNHSTRRQILFIGLGVMGYPMAGHLAKYLNQEKNTPMQLLVYNRTYSKAVKFIKEHQEKTPNLDLFAIESLENISAKFKHIDLVLTCVKDDESIKQIFFSNARDKGLLDQLQAESIIIDHSSITAKLSIKMNELAKEKKIDFLDAPISGGQVGAMNGQLAIMVGGKKQAFNKTLLIMKAYGKTIVYMGKSGTGQIAKMCNQICITGLLQSLSEAIVFAEKSGINIENLISVISQGAAGSWQMSNRAISMHKREFDFGFAVDLMVKDLKNTIEQAKGMNLELPVSELIYGFYQELRDNGDSKSDTSSLIKRLQ